MSRKIIGVTVGTALPKPNLMQTDPTKGDYVKGKDGFSDVLAKLRGLATRTDAYGNKVLYLTQDGEILGDGVILPQGGGGGGTGNDGITLANDTGWIYKTIAAGAECPITFSWYSLQGGLPTGPGALRITNNGTQKHLASVAQGSVTLDIAPYLAAGSNEIHVYVSDAYGESKNIIFNISVVAISLASDFDNTVPYTGAFNYVYTPTGAATKTVHFKLDGNELPTATVTVSGRQQTQPIQAQSHGSHTLEVWFDAEVGGNPVESNRLIHDIICLEDGKTDPVIACDLNVATAEQYENIVIPYRVYNPASMTAAITLDAPDLAEPKNLTVDRTVQEWTYRADTAGAQALTITCGDTVKTIDLTITESKIHVEAETDSLALHLSSYGRSNNEENPGVWKSGDIAAQFRDFNFVSDGWKQDDDGNTVLRVSGDARLHIPYKMFAKDFRTTGKTIEFEMATREVLDYDAEVLNCYSGGRGFSITAQQLILASEQSQMGTRYKEDEHIRVTFVVEKKSKNRLLLCYINGIMSGGAQYPVDDDFSQADPVGITIGSNQCTTDLYNIRVYDNDLSKHQVLDNWIADTQDPVDRRDRYTRNAIYNEYGNVVIAKLPRDLCYLVLECPELPKFKGDKKTCSGYFVDPVHPERSFSFTGTEIDVQGTSSQYYYRKNFKKKFKNGFILADGSTVTAYQMNDQAVPVSTFTMKADVASSEGYYNVVTAKLFNKHHPFKMPAQEEDPRARYSIDGFPIVIFWDNGTDTKFLGKYNFNNDKGTFEPFGLSEGDERWEVLQNGTARVGFHSADFSDDSWKEDFEGNFPDGNTDLTNLQPMCEWVTATDADQATGYEIEPVTYGGVEYTEDTAEYRLAKFSAELSEHFVEDAVIYYMVFTEAFLCMDQREKNVLWRYIKSLNRWLADYYDADSIIGHNNQAQPVFDYWMEDIDHTASGDPVFNGQNSTFWKNLRATRADEIKAEWHRLRDAGFSYESVMAAFEEHKSKWPEAIYNEDMQAKCLDALVESGDTTYLPFLRGDKWAWTQWWMYNRFRYLDSKYEYGTSTENRATIRTNVMANLFLTYYVHMYGNVYYNAEHVALRVEKDTEYEFVSHATGAEDRVIGINDADMITSLGDLAPHMVELIDLSKMIKLLELKLGDGAEDYVNRSLTSVTFGNNILLRKVDIRNCVALTQAIDLSGCTNIEEVYLDGTSVTGVSLPNGGILKKLHLPGTITNLTIRNQKALTEFVLPDYSKITTLRLENNSEAIPMADILAAVPANSRVRLIGFDWSFDSAADVLSFCDRLDTMRGLDENGNNTDKAQVSGTVRVENINSPQLVSIQQRYPDIHVVYENLAVFVAFYDETGENLLHTVEGTVDGSVSYPGETLTKESTAQHHFAFAGWSRTIGGEADPDILDNIGMGGNFYAVFTATVRTYTVRFWNDTKLEQTVTVPYGDNAVYPGDELVKGEDYAFTGWEPMPNNVTADMDCYAQFAFSGYYYKSIINKTLSGEYTNTLATSVAGYAFVKFNDLIAVKLPAVTYIDNYGFQQCPNLTTVDLSSDVTICVAAFYNCVNLATIILRSKTVCTAESTSCIGKPSQVYVYVPAALVDTYKAATNWSAYADKIRAIEDYPEICGGDA